MDTGTQTDELDARIVDTGTLTDELDPRSKVDLGGTMKCTICSTPHQYVHCLTVILISPSRHMLLTVTLIPMPIMIVLSYFCVLSCLYCVRACGCTKLY